MDRTKSVYFNKFNPNPGDTVTAFVRVFNYSLASMNQVVPFSLYNGNPNEGGTIIADVMGNTVFDTGENLENQGRVTVSVDFIVTNEMIEGVDNRIYVQLDPANAIAEIHEENNLGGAHIGLACNTPDGPVGISDIEFEDNEFIISVFPNPGSEWINIDFQKSLQFLNDNLRLSIVDITGKLILNESFRSDGSGIYRLDVSNLPQGIYIYQLSNGTEEVYSGKLVVR